MSSWATGDRPITIAILAMGGEGGGVLADWIVNLGERAGYVSQNTSVAGVAQRTGATVYYVELYPPKPGREGDVLREPVLSLFPTPGEVDVVIASELMEAGRAIQRGFATPDRTTLIASTNRVYAMDEKRALADGRVDSNALLEACQISARRFIGADFMQLAVEARSVISASLFGALAGSGALDFPREYFEDAIRASGKGVAASLQAFELGFTAACLPAPIASPTPKPSSKVAVNIGRRTVDPAEEATSEAQRRGLAVSDPAQLVGPELRGHAERVGLTFPASSRSMLLHGVVRCAVYQDEKYSSRLLDRVETVLPFEPDAGGDARLVTEVARYTALRMCYQDTIQVGLQKIRRRRLEGVRAEAKAAPNQLVNVREFLHPQVEEIADTLPAGLGRWLTRSKAMHRVIGAMTRDGMRVNTTGIFGFTQLWLLTRLRPLRPRSYRFGREQEAIDQWLQLIRMVAPVDYALACEVAECAKVLKGYGATYQHGAESFVALMAVVPDLCGKKVGAQILQQLRSAALADGDRTALRAELDRLRSTDLN